MTAPKLLEFLGALIVMGGLVSCSAQPIPLDPKTLSFDDVLAGAQQDGGKNQISILTDGNISSVELNSALAAYFECLETSGLTYVDNGPNPLDGWRPLMVVSWAGLSDAEGPSRDAACSRANWDYVNLGYELTNDDVMEPPLMAAVQVCLESAGVETHGTERNVNDLLPLGHDDAGRAKKVETCIYSEIADYPNGAVLVY